jgi:23S rRNA (adenine-N6)-dimethyltransferase
VARGDLVLDIGAGDGALTGPLLELGARVVAIELHPGRAAALRRRFGDDVRVVQTDAIDLRLPRRPFRVVANPPWVITEPLLRRLLHPGSRLVRADLLLKRSTARRWADLGHANGHRFQAGPTVPRRAFRPPPPTDGRVLVIERVAQRR